MTPTFKPNKVAFEQWLINLNEELETPLSLLSSTLNQLCEEEVDLTRKEQLTIALDLSNQFSALMHNLNLTALEQSKQAVLSISKVCIESFVQDITTKFKDQAHEQGKEIHLHMELQKTMTYVDLYRLQKILGTLISNGIQFSNSVKGRVDVTIAINPDEYKITVQDDGIGIVPEKLAHVFDPLYDDDPVHLKLFQSTSAGLYLIWLYTMSLNGQLSVESEKEVFTRFTLQLPLLQSPKDINYRHYEFAQSSHNVSLSHERNLAFANDYKVQRQVAHQRQMALALAKDETMNGFSSYFESSLSLMMSNDSALVLARALHLQPSLIILEDHDFGEISTFQVAETLKNHKITKNIPLVWISKNQKLGKADLNLTNDVANYERFEKIANLLDLRSKLLKELQSDKAMKQIKPKYQNSKEAFLTRLERVVDAHLTRGDLNMEKLASMLFLNRSQIHRKVKSFTGMNTTEYIRNYKLKIAYKDLEQQNGSISEIAYRCGFNSPSYFSKSFKETFGIAPSDVHEQLDD